MSQKKNKKKSKKQDKKVSAKKTVKSKPLSRFHMILGGIVFALAFFLYSNTLLHDYALDDNSVITDSHIVRGGIKNIPKVFQTRYREGSFGASSTMYRPMSVAMFAVEWNIAPGSAKLSHFVNVFMFAATCLLMFLTFKEILGKYSIWIPFLSVAFFAAHPIHTEIVANIKSRDEILVLFFGMLALNMIWKYATQGKQTKYHILSCVALGAAMFSKENAVNFVALIPLTLYFFSKLDFKKIVVIGLSYLIPTFVYLSARFMILGNKPSTNTIDKIDNFLAAENATFMEQKATALWVLGKYLVLLVYPNPLICDYNYNYIPITNLSNPLVFISLLVHLGILIYALMNLRSKKFLSYTILFYLINMALYSNLVLVIGAGLGERFLYIASFGFCLALAYGITHYLGGGVLNDNQPKSLDEMFKNQTSLLSVIGVIIFLFGFQTMYRNFDWYDSFTLYKADIVKAPESARLNGYIGTAYLKAGKEASDPTEKQEYFDKAIEVYTNAVTIYPEYTEALGQLGLSYFRKGNYAEASKWYEKAIADPGCKGSIYSNYGWLYYNDAIAKNQQNNSQGFQIAINKAKEMYEESLRREPNYSDGYMNLGSTLGMMGDHNGAVRNFETALKYAKDEQKAGIYGNLAKAYANLGRQTDAQNAQINANRYR